MTALTALTNASTSLMQKQNEMTMVIPRIPFSVILHIIAFGSWMEASFSSSLMCAPASGPMKHQMADVRPMRVLRTIRAPATAVIELSEDLVSRCVIGHDPEDDEEGEEAKDVSEQNDSFGQWQVVGAPRC